MPKINMKLKINLFYSILIIGQINIIISSNNKNNLPKSSDSCTLTGRPSHDPFPSLSKCYKYNNEACCLSVHDDFISNYVDSILSPSCVRKYTEFENLMCFGCHPLENYYIDSEKKQIRICKSFADRFWNSTDEEGGLEKPTTIFDNCGFKVDLPELEILANGSNYIIPSEVFQSFHMFFEYIKIPFYDNYEIIIQEENDEYCYNYSSYIKISLFYLVLYYILIV